LNFKLYIYYKLELARQGLSLLTDSQKMGISRCCW